MSDLTKVLNEMTMPFSGDFGKVQQASSGNVELYQILMTAANLHTTIATIMQKSGNSRAAYHKALAEKLRVDANQTSIRR
jgi:hypothetical protein